MAKTTKPAEAKTPTIKVLVEAPTLRGSRALRWPLIVQAKTPAELSALLKENGFKQSGAATLRWLTKAGLVKMD